MVTLFVMTYVKKVGQIPMTITEPFMRFFKEMIKNKTVLVDFTNCEHIGRIHPIIKEAFGFPDEYGENWSAFRDFLFWEYPVSKVIVKGASSLPTIFYNDMNIFRETLEDMKKECESNAVAFEYEFE